MVRRRRLAAPDPDKCLCKIMSEHNMEIAEIKKRSMNFKYLPRAKCYDCKDPFNTKCDNYKRFE